MMKQFQVVLKVEGSVDLNDPSMQEAVLNNVSCILSVANINSRHVSLNFSTALKHIYFFKKDIARTAY